MPCLNCDRWFHQGHSVCPSCNSQLPEHVRERRLAEERLATAPLTPRAKALVNHRIYEPSEVRGDGRFPGRQLTRKNPNRRAAFRLTGRYFREEEAHDLLNQISTHRWIEAEKAGHDVWTEINPADPQRAASQDWLDRHFMAWLNHLQVMACETC